MTMDLLRDLEVSKKHWLHTPLTEQWDGPKLDGLVQHVDRLLKKWKSSSVSPFSPDVDTVVVDTVATLQQAGVFWFNNGILPPDEEPSNWPFHLKALERWAVGAKAERVGLSIDQAAGYVCSAGEGHEYCIRAARQDIRRAAPTAPVTLVAGQSAHPGVQSAAEMLGLPLVRVRCGLSGEMDVADLDAVLGNTCDAIIVVATWRSMNGGGYDDLGAISKRLSTRAQRTGLPALLHLDAVRCFDDVTTLGRAERTRLGLPRLFVGDSGQTCASASASGSGVSVATVVAGGANVSGMGSELVVALKPRGLGATHGQFVECVAGSDDTVSGSRDALGGALVALHEARFGRAGLRRMYQQCRLVCDAVTTQLTVAGVPVRTDARGLDVVVEAGPWMPTSLFDRWGARRLADGAAMLAVQPASTLASAGRLLQDFGIGARSRAGAQGLQGARLGGFAVPTAMTGQLRQAAATWRAQSTRSCGYPGNHATLSVVGSIVGHVLAAPFVPEAAAWTAARARELLDGTCAALAVEPGRATAAFTSGSTASNRIGILTALAELPHATLYASAAAHYSLAKIAADHDRLRTTAVVNVPTDALGRMVPSVLARCLARDKRNAAAAGSPFAAVLLATVGTTFSGAVDDLDALHAAAARVSCRIDYIHLDGALNLGASMARFTLGPPGSDPVEPTSGRYVVQGISVSQHKFPGLSVAGQVVCWTPPSSGRLAGYNGHVDRRAVFELWLYRQLVSQDDSDALYQHCLANARRLRSRLQDAGITTLFNPESVITLVQRQPAWLINRFNLSPEGNWVHFITMPHVGLSVIDEFVNAVVDHATAVARALVPVRQHIAQLFACLDSDVTLKQLNGVDESLLASVTSALYGEHIVSPTTQAEKIKVEWTNSTLCFAAIDNSGALIAALLCRLSRDRAVDSCAVLLRESALVLQDVPEVHHVYHTLAALLVGSLFSHQVVTTQNLAAQNIMASIISNPVPAVRTSAASIDSACSLPESKE